MTAKLTPRTLVLAGTLFLAVQASAGEVMRLSGASIQHSAQAVGLSVQAGAKLFSAVLAIPLEGIHQIGLASGAVAEALDPGIGTADTKALPVSDEVLTVLPTPQEALNGKTKASSTE